MRLEVETQVLLHEPEDLLGAVDRLAGVGVFEVLDAHDRRLDEVHVFLCAEAAGDYLLVEVGNLFGHFRLDALAQGALGRDAHDADLLFVRETFWPGKDVLSLAGLERYFHVVPHLLASEFVLPLLATAIMAIHK